MNKNPGPKTIPKKTLPSKSPSFCRHCEEKTPPGVYFCTPTHRNLYHHSEDTTTRTKHLTIPQMQSRLLELGRKYKASVSPSQIEIESIFNGAAPSNAASLAAGDHEVATR